MAATDDITVLINLGNGQGVGGFGAQTTFAVGSGPFAMTSGDFAGNGNRDLAIANQNDGTVSVLLGNGLGSFGPQTTFAAGSVPSGITAGDFNGDGHLDLVVALFSANAVAVLPGTGTGSFSAPTTFAVGHGPAGPATAISTAMAGSTSPCRATTTTP